MERDCDQIQIKESGQGPYKTCLSGFPTFLANLSARLSVIWNTRASLISAGGSPLDRLPWRKGAIRFHRRIKASIFFPKWNATTFQNSSPNHTNFLYSVLKIWLGKYDWHPTDITKTRKLLVWGYISIVPKIHAECFQWQTSDIWEIHFCLKKYDEQHKPTA